MKIATYFLALLVTATSLVISNPQTTSAYTDPLPTNCGITWTQSQKTMITNANATFNFTNTTHSYVLSLLSPTAVRLYYHPTQQITFTNGSFTVPTGGARVSSSTLAFSTAEDVSVPYAGTNAGQTCIQITRNVAYTPTYTSTIYPSETPVTPPPPTTPPPASSPTNLVRNTTQIPTTATCYYIRDDKTLDVWTTSTNKETYTLVSDTYYKQSTVTETKPSTINCITRQAVTDLKSPYDFISPVLHMIAIASIAIIVYIAYKLILYPFFRKRI